MGAADAVALEVSVRARCAVAEAGVEGETVGAAEAGAPEVRVADASCAVAEAEVGVDDETVGVADAVAPEVRVEPGCWSAPAAASCSCSSRSRAGSVGWRAPIHASAWAAPSAGPPVCPSRLRGSSDIGK